MTLLATALTRVFPLFAHPLLAYERSSRRSLVPALLCASNQLILLVCIRSRPHNHWEC